MSELLSRVRAEIEQRLQELRPLVSEYEQMLDAAGALGIGTEPPASRPPNRMAQRNADGKPRARRGAAEHAIVAALEHGSHTVGELAIVTAMSGADIRTSARRLLAAGKVVRAKRDGRAAYALSGNA